MLLWLGWQLLLWLRRMLLLLLLLLRFDFTCQRQARLLALVPQSCVNLRFSTRLEDKLGLEFFELLFNLNTALVMVLMH